MNPTIQLRVMLSEPQAFRLQQRIATLPFKITYQEEQHGASLVGLIDCTPMQEKTMREILQEIGAAVAPLPDE